MDFELLSQTFDRLGYSYAAKKLANIEVAENKLNTLKAILEDCQAENVKFADDIRVLLEQIRSLSSYDKSYEGILLKDFHCVLKEFIERSEDEAFVFLEEEEWADIIALYQKAMQKDPVAQYQLAVFYKNIGREEWAFHWYQAASNLGNIDATYWLGNYYYDGIVVEKNDAKTFSCYKKAALAGHPDAMNNYADMYLRGEVVEKDEKRALELFHIAADRGVPEAMYTLGFMFDNGVGTEKDSEMATHWYTQSAIHGDNFAANRLGHRAFEKGNDEEAFKWYRVAADRGDAFGEYNIGLCYESGIGTEINTKKAKQWYQKAAIKGDEQAKLKLKQFK